MPRTKTEIRPVSSALRIVLIVEASEDARTVAELIDKILLQHDESPYRGREREELSKIREWYQLDPPVSGQVPHVTWKWLAAHGVRVGKTAEDGPFEYARAARRAIATLVDHCAVRSTVVDAVVLVVDADGDAGRLKGLDNGQRTVNFDGTVVIGVPMQEREAWVLNAIEATSGAQNDVLRALKNELEVDCIRDAHKLSANDRAINSTKKVLERVLTAGRGRPKRKKGSGSDERFERELEAIRARSLAELHERGKASGLSAFLAQAETIFGRITAAHSQAGAQTP